MQKARRHRPEGRLRPFVSVWFQVLLTPLIGVLFIFQSPYWSTIGRPGIFSLAGWAPQLHTEFHELRATLVHLPHVAAHYRTVTFYGWPFQTIHVGLRSDIGVHNPGPKPGLGYSDFARRY